MNMNEKHNNSQKRLKKGRFVKGMPKVEGSGRKAGTPNKTTSEVRNLLEENRIALIAKAIEMAQAGNVQILMKLLDKLLPNLSHTKSEQTGLTLEEFLLCKIQEIQEKQS